MLNIKSVLSDVKSKYWPLLKAGQTSLLAITGLAGYFSAYPFPIRAWELIGLLGTLFLTISGSTVINMWFDRDIDARMPRTRRRPLVTGQVDARLALWLGIGLVAGGLAWSVVLSPVYAVVALAGLFSEVVVYTLLLKRRSAWSVALGGIAGGMPILGGRVIATGSVDAIGLLLALAVLLWTPAHNLSYNMLRFNDYQRAGVPTFPSVYGTHTTRWIILLSSALVGLVMTTVSVWIALPTAALVLLIALQAGLVGLAVIAWLRPSTRVSARLFKYASAYMLGCMVLLATAVL
jgi:protoheme IX farnesyltransferase